MPLTTLHPSTHTSDAQTNGVRVHVESFHLPEESVPDQKRFVFGYRVTITNLREEAVRLLSRHWVIIDGNGGRDEVRGDGVVGHQPTLSPGHSFRYTSYCPMATEWGTMEGAYHFIAGAGHSFDVSIARFILAVKQRTV